MMKTILLVALVFLGCGGGAGGPGEMGAGGDSGPGAAGTGTLTGSGGASVGAGTAGAAAAAGAAGSAGPGVEVVQQALSGTRLKAYWQTGADGSKQFAGYWFDSALKVDCSFGLRSDGKQRCMPTSPIVLFAATPSAFADAGCTVPLVLTSKSTCPTAQAASGLVNVYETNAGCTAIVMHDLGAQFTGQVFQGSTAACTAASAAATMAQNYFRVGPPADLSKYQEATLAHD
jgi:hypothetical protein